MLRRGWPVLFGIVVVAVRSFGFILSLDCDDTAQYFLWTLYDGQKTFFDLVSTQELSFVSQ
jgi:hypothetical protein